MTAVTDRPAFTDPTVTTEASETPTTADLVARVVDLHRTLRANAARGEEDRRVVEESIQALRGAGLLKIAQPRRYGGYETSLRTMLDVSAAVAEADGGTAWVVTLLNSGAWMVGTFPQQAQDDVWADDPDALVSGVVTPTAESRKVDGGHRVTGRWYYNSGSHHSQWAVLGIPVTDESGEVVDQGLALIPRTDLDFEDTWFVAGMRASGSNCLIGTDVFVPDHRVVSVTAALEGRYATEHTEESLYRLAFVSSLAVMLIGPQLGLGRAALDLVKLKAAKKPVSNTLYTAQADSVAFQLEVAQAAMLLETAHLHAQRAADDVDRAATAGTFPDYLTRARIRADVGWAADHVVRAINVLLSAHGAASFAEVNPLQRIWRDSSVAARHAVVTPAVGYEIYGKALLERDDHITPLV